MTHNIPKRTPIYMTAPELRAKYGAPGKTDDQGFNPYADTVGPGTSNQIKGMVS